MATRRVLHSDIARHYLAIGVVVVLSLVATVALIVAARAVGPDPLGALLAFPAAISFVAIGLYGPLYLLLTHLAFRDLRGRRLRAHLRATHPREGVLRVLLIGGPKWWAAAIALLGTLAVGALLFDADARSNPIAVGSSLVLLAGSWVLLVAVYAVEYARQWARTSAYAFSFSGSADDRSAADGDTSRDGPSLADFVYLAVQVSTTFSTSDVETRSTAARRMVTAHAVVAFAYNTVIVAVFVSVLLTIATS